MPKPHVVKPERVLGGGWKAQCRCGWSFFHLNYGAAVQAGNQHKNEEWANAQSRKS